MGIAGSTTGELTFDGARIPAANLLGEEGEGFRIAMRILDRSRPGVAAQGLGIAQGATDYALEYARTRETMGKPIAEHQLIAAKLADMETRCEAARGLLYRFGRMVDEGADDAELTKASAMAKLYCTDTAMDVTTEAVQILGGYGYIREYPVERMMRDAKITQIYEGTNEIQRLVIAREMLKESRAFLLAGVSYSLAEAEAVARRAAVPGEPLRHRARDRDRVAPVAARDEQAGLAGCSGHDSRTSHTPVVERVTSVSAARETGRRAPSTVGTVTSTPREVRRNVTAPRRSEAGRTTTAADATSEPRGRRGDGSLAEHAACPEVTRRPARGRRCPSVAGVTLQGDAGASGVSERVGRRRRESRLATRSYLT